MRPRLLLFALGLALAASVYQSTATDSYEFLGATWPAEAMPVPYCVNVNGIPQAPSGRPDPSARI